MLRFFFNLLDVNTIKINIEKIKKQISLAKIETSCLNFK